MELESRHLRVVCAVAEHNSLTRAAAALGMSQPNLSRQLQRLERALGGALFVRHERGTSPTPLGSYVLARARAVLPAMDELSLAASRHCGAVVETERLRCGATQGPLGTRLMPILRELNSTAEVTLLSEDSGALLCDLVVGGFIELAALVESAGYEAPARPELDRRVVATAPMCLLLAETHPLAARFEVDLAELTGEDWVIKPPADNRIRENLTMACHERGFEPVIRYEAGASEARELIRDGYAIGLGLSTFRATPGIAVRPIVGDPFWEKNELVWHKTGPLSDIGDKLVGRARVAYQEAAEQSPARQARQDREQRQRV
ncbi:LysR family transcriptional regulator [Haloechinothrix sp. YIM 98757]|uniref:LysR family transcriptional regulator n=1 Tax=Haloechinothrix aidingensis TaxID=2752311 RepID=A0A838ACB6_9PSEU|nr:LysR family transcriptional regulator [Haloechinothrix aidingensis]MBA0126906.1 LysR family transcriptional regulator [Haloechinothrix aidingensis]